MNVVFLSRNGPRGECTITFSAARHEQPAGADEIINRTNSGRFLSAICSVVKQPGQFSFVRGGRIPEIASNAQYRTALAIAKIAMADGWDDPAPKALYFHARRVSPGWGKARVATIGNHIFFR